VRPLLQAALTCIGADHDDTVRAGRAAAAEAMPEACGRDAVRLTRFTRTTSAAGRTRSDRPGTPLAGTGVRSPMAAALDDAG
jgi:hypothetical protein